MKGNSNDDVLISIIAMRVHPSFSYFFFIFHPVVLELFWSLGETTRHYKTSPVVEDFLGDELLLINKNGILHHTTKPLLCIFHLCMCHVFEELVAEWPLLIFCS